MPDLTRRRFLGGTAAATGVGGRRALLPAASRKATGVPADQRAKLGEIKHVCC